MKKLRKWKGLEDQKREPVLPRFMARCRRYDEDLKQQAAEYHAFSGILQKHTKFLTGLSYELTNVRSTKEADRLHEKVSQQIKRVREDIEHALKGLPSGG